METKRYYLILGLIFLILCLLSLTFPLLSFQEARRAVLIQESFLNHSLVPTYNGEPYFTKPPLHMWLSLPFFAMGYPLGLEISFLRLLSFLSYGITLYFLYLICERDPRKTLLSLLILFSSFRFLSFIYRLDLEPLFILFSTGAFYFLLSFHRLPSFSKALLFYLFMALSFLVRGPLNFFWFPALFIYGLLSKNPLTWRLLFFVPGWLLFSGLILSWFLWGVISFGKEVFSTFFSTDIGERLTARKDPFYYYFRALLLNFFPYVLLLLLKSKELMTRLKAYLQFPQGFYLSFFLVPLVMLSFTGEKFDKYLLFLYPVFSVFISQTLLTLYNYRWLLRLGLVLVFINFGLVTGLQLIQLEDLKFKSQAVANSINPKEKYAFYLESHPFLLFLLKRPIPVLQEEKEVYLALKEGISVISPREFSQLTPKKILPDPYKRGRYLFLYSMN